MRDAVLEAHRLAVAEPENGQASGRLGIVLLANNLFPPAELAFQRAIRLQPNQFDWRYYLALTLQQESKLEEALDAITGALRIQGDYTPAAIRRGELLFELGRLEESSSALESVLKKNPDSAAAYYALARVKNAQGDLQSAAELYRKAWQSHMAFGPAYFGLAEVEKRLGKDEDAARHFALAEKYKGFGPDPGDPLLAQMTALATGVINHINQAHQLMERGEMQKASQLLQDVLQREPDNLDALLNILFVGPVEGNPTLEEFAGFYETARKLAPQNPQLYLYYGKIQAESGNDTEAVATLTKGIQLKPDDVEARTLLGNVLVKGNRLAAALDQYRLALKAQPDYRPAQHQQAQTLMRMGRYREAIPELHRLLEVEDADTATTMVFLAQAYANTGDPVKATEYLQHARARVLQTGPQEMLAVIDQGLLQLGSHP